MLLAMKFQESAKPSESLAENGDDPSGAMLEGEEASFLD